MSSRVDKLKEALLTASIVKLVANDTTEGLYLTGALQPVVSEHSECPIEVRDAELVM